MPETMIFLFELRQHKLQIQIPNANQYNKYINIVYKQEMCL